MRVFFRGDVDFVVSLMHPTYWNGKSIDFTVVYGIYVISIFPRIFCVVTVVKTKKIQEAGAADAIQFA